MSETTTSSSMSGSLTPIAALGALNLEHHQNIHALQSLLVLLAQKLPDAPPENHKIVIVGLRGVGKSTLALMALAALGFKYLDVEKCVSKHTGMPEAVYLQKVTVEQYQELQYRLVTEAIYTNRGSSLIIVVPLTIINSTKLLQYLKGEDFKYIINVECEEERILNYLNFEGNDGVLLIQDKFSEFRSISTHDFFNYFSEADRTKRTLISIGQNRGEVDEDVTSSLVLKPVEKDFIKYMTFLIRGPDAASASVGNLHLRLPFYQKFTNCLVITFPAETDIFVPGTLIGVDSIEITVDMTKLIRKNLCTSKLRLNEYISKIRRFSNSSIPLILSIKNSLEEVSLFIREYSISSTNDLETVRTDMKNYYLTLLGSAIRLGIEYLSIDLSLCTDDSSNFFVDAQTSTDMIFQFLGVMVANSGSTEIMGTFHSNSPQFWDSGAISVLELANALSIDIVRMSAVANLLSDNSRITNFQKTAQGIPHLKDIRVCAFNRGPLGRTSKVFNQNFTPVVLEREVDENSVEENVTALQLQKSLFAAFLLPKLHFYIMGMRVSTSASPLLHGEVYKAMGLPYEYHAFECSKLMPSLSNLVKLPHFGGAAIIMPFKLEALKYVDSMSNHVKVIGALNTIVAERSVDQPNKIIKIRGENTDWLGVRIVMQDNTSPINAVSANKTALVIGAGGMSRSAIYALIQLGYQNILLYNRTYSRAEELARYYNMLSPMLPSKALTTGKICDSKRELKQFHVTVLTDNEFKNGLMPQGITAFPCSIVSCVPSSNPRTGELTNIHLSENWFSSPSGGVVLETGYDPLVSSIIARGQEFKSKGWEAVNGLNWLLAQAITQFEMLTGKQAPLALMTEVVSRLYNQRS